jgi:AraC family transcriptional regulator of adaptative response / DNA-3-methyladenine glycosylase II
MAGINSNLNLAVYLCQQARLSRDARFDGHFFNGVLTTGYVFSLDLCYSITL